MYNTSAMNINQIIQFYIPSLYFLSVFTKPFWIIIIVIYIVDCQLQMMCQYLNGHRASFMVYLFEIDERNEEWREDKNPKCIFCSIKPLHLTLFGMACLGSAWFDFSHKKTAIIGHRLGNSMFYLINFKTS